MDELFSGAPQILDDNLSRGDQATTSDDSIALHEAYWSAVIKGRLQTSGSFLADLPLPMVAGPIWCELFRPPDFVHLPWSKVTKSTDKLSLAFETKSEAWYWD